MQQRCNRKGGNGEEIGGTAKNRNTHLDDPPTRRTAESVTGDVGTTPTSLACTRKKFRAVPPRGKEAPSVPRERAVVCTRRDSRVRSRLCARGIRTRDAQWSHEEEAGLSYETSHNCTSRSARPRNVICLRGAACICESN